MAKPVIVTGSLRDIHSVGLRVLGYTLQKEFNIVSTGAMVEQEDLINAAIETNAKAILVSSLYGHAELDCQGFREKCVEAGLKDIILYVGGNLVVGAERSWEQVEAAFKKMGFDRVYPTSASPTKVLNDLKKDLGVE